MFADLANFQLLNIKITDSQQKKYLQQVLEQEKKDTVYYGQSEAITRKETERRMKRIESEATEIAQNAEARVELITDKARVEAKAIVERARTSGLSILYKALNITTEDEKKAFDYIRTLRNQKNSNIYIGFDTVVAKP